jgi:hypothetical protein
MRLNQRADIVPVRIGVAGVSVRGLVGYRWQYGASDRVVFRMQIGAESCRTIGVSAWCLVVPVQTPDVLVYLAASSSAPTPYA